MILILFALIVSATADPDYYAVQIESGYKIFTKLSKCRGAVYQSGDNRVLFQDDVWKIGKLKNELDCNNLSSIVEEEYRNKGIQMPKTKYWIDIDGNNVLRRILIEGFNKRVEVTGLNLVGGTKVDAKNEENCLKKNWGKQYPDKDIVVAFQNSKCFYDFVDQAKLSDNYDDYYDYYDYDYYDYGAIIFVHPAGKNKIRMIFF